MSQLITNLLVLAGNIGREPEFIAAQGNTDARLTFTLGHNVIAPDGTKLRTEWVRVIAWGVNAQDFNKLKLTKGDNVQVAGRFGIKKWQNEEGSVRQIVELTAKEIKVIRRQANRVTEQKQL